MNKQNEGRIGEDLACNYLLKKGYRIIERNFHSRIGEIDIIAQKGKNLIFVEVKARSSMKYGEPETAVTKYKLRSIIRTAEYYKLLNPQTPEIMQIDVLAIKLNNVGEILSLKHLENVSL